MKIRSTVPADPEYDLVEPSPSALIESLRSVGYNPPTAVADIVDNSISAGARNIRIHFNWNEGNPIVSITDDGHGMAEDELTEAMRAGSRSPLDERSPEDLGRFGLGLKTASFSQARALTVFTKRSLEREDVRCWDLDYVKKKKGWRLLKLPHDDISRVPSPLDGEPHGTAVVWTNVDRLLQSPGANKSAESRVYFNKVIREVGEHLAMVFHRFLSGEAGQSKRITIVVNGNRITPWDPFATSHPSTQNLGDSGICFHDSPVSIAGYVLPHKSRLTAEEFDTFGGGRGWSAQQGFYVYRNHRLLVAGDWLGLGTGVRWKKTEQTRLARIRLDIENQTDDAWYLDIKKSTARPPGALHSILTQIGDAVRDRAIRVFRHRGEIQAATVASPTESPWIISNTAAGNKYRINRTHPAVEQALIALGRRAPDLEAAFRVIEATVPVEQIWLDVAQDSSSPASPFANEDEDVLRADVRRLIDFYQNKGMPRRDATAKVRGIYPYTLAAFNSIFASGNL